ERGLDRIDDARKLLRPVVVVLANEARGTVTFLGNGNAGGLFEGNGQLIAEAGGKEIADDEDLAGVVELGDRSRFGGRRRLCGFPGGAAGFGGPASPALLLLTLAPGCRFDRGTLVDVASAAAEEHVKQVPALDPLLGFGRCDLRRDGEHNGSDDRQAS